MKGKTGCMICGKEKNGAEVEEDHVIRLMRWFKENVTRNAKGYRIVVCKECMPEYKKLRSKFVRRRIMYVGLGVLFTVTIAVVAGSRHLLGVVAYGVAITIFLYLLSLVSYMPALKQDGAAEKPKSRRSPP